MAGGDHRIKIGSGDTVILASSLIPGNETSVFRVINGLTRLGARVVHSGNAKVHVSGHSAAGELLYAYNILKPKNVMPVHGEVRHLIANAQLAIKTGVDPRNVIIAEDGFVIDLKDGQASIVGQVPAGHIYVDGSSVGVITEEELGHRRILGEEGFVSIFTVVDHTAKKIVVPPVVQARGMVESDDVFEAILPEIIEALDKALKAGSHDNYQLQQIMRRVLGAWIARRLRRKPMIMPTVVEAE
jgi:ribonuclease J